MIRRLLAWLHHDPRMARHATLAAIRQESELHPAEKGDHHDRDLPVVSTARPARVPPVWAPRLPQARYRDPYQAQG